ncbi:hypothetical protein PHLCEN_2v2641, partial [Hermanssonia centrifuga]
IGVESVSSRQTKKIRDTEHVICWFESRTSYKISKPPNLPSKLGLEAEDLYIHGHAQGRYQAWRCTGLGPPKWIPLPQGTKRKLPGLKEPRHFVLTAKGLPSWVLSSSLDRAYKGVKTEALRSTS